MNEKLIGATRSSPRVDYVRRIWMRSSVSYVRPHRVSATGPVTVRSSPYQRRSAEIVRGKAWAVGAAEGRGPWLVYRGTD